MPSSKKKNSRRKKATQERPPRELSAAEKDALGRELFELCGRGGSFDAIRRCLEKGADANYGPYDDGVTGLFFACGRHGRVDVARLLLAKGANVDQRDRYGGSPVYLACVSGKVDAARFLLENGADVTQVNNNGAS
mmetsp:Transcript_29196/g.89309  ORF Transcript_29196/g.89309 Transcript_29196/m.89309 type:complete len:136 (-) Transcript_29196:699-1106(-)